MARLHRLRRRLGRLSRIELMFVKERHFSLLGVDRVKRDDLTAGGCHHEHFRRLWLFNSRITIDLHSACGLHLAAQSY